MADATVFPATLDTPATVAFPILPGHAMPEVPRALYVGRGGDVTGIAVDDTVPVTFANLPAGCVLPVRFKHILSATAGGLVGLV